MIFGFLLRFITFSSDLQQMLTVKNYIFFSMNMFGNCLVYKVLLVYNIEKVHLA